MAFLKNGHILQIFFCRCSVEEVKKVDILQSILSNTHLDNNIENPRNILWFDLGYSLDNLGPRIDYLILQ